MTLDITGTAFTIAYLCSLLVIGTLARRASTESSLKDYYLAGGSLGVLSLFFTLYATQYSGNSFFGLPGMAYRHGVMAAAFILGVMGIVLTYQLYAVRLQRLAAQHQFISVGDFILWRYRSGALLLAVNIVFTITLVTFILGNLKAIGILIESASGGLLPAAIAIVMVCFIMAIYEALGGMRGVIWTDMIQGMMLMGGSLLVFFFLARTRPDGVINDPGILAGAVSDFFSQPLPTLEFLTLALLIALGAGVYPQAIQRIYAARSASVLQRSYLLMFFMPLVTTLPLFLIGMSGAQWFPGLDRSGSEQVVILAIGGLVQDSQGLAWLSAIYIGAAIAAIMSTIDSALLTMGSIVNKDIVARRYPHFDQPRLHSIGRRLTWVLVAMMAVLAISLPQTIWSLLVLKLELVIQVFPAIILGVRTSTARAMPLLAGLAAGCLVAALLRYEPSLSPLPAIHSGIWALCANLVVLGLAHLLSGPASAKQARLDN